ncbi:uncharacterized protein CC84DRAFT_1078291, partial [Paraphaeosphaeria sporulosa]
CAVEESIYRYHPSLPANAAFAALFLIATIVHFVLGLRWKTPWVMWCTVLSCTHEVAGYIARVLLYINPWNFGAFITQILCITQAPVFYCAAIYVMLGQRHVHTGHQLLRLRPRTLPCQVFRVNISSLRNRLSAASSGDDNNGVRIAMAGLIFQVVTLVAFSALFADLIFRLLSYEHAKKLTRRDGLFFVFLILAILLTLVGCTFRAYELKEGYKGELITHEDLFIALEGV